MLSLYSVFHTPAIQIPERERGAFLRKKVRLTKPNFSLVRLFSLFAERAVLQLLDVFDDLGLRFRVDQIVVERTEEHAAVFEGTEDHFVAEGAVFGLLKADGKHAGVVGDDAAGNAGVLAEQVGGLADVDDLDGIAVGLVDGLSWQEIVFGLQQGHAQLRLVAVHTENGALLLDDTYNASPESDLAALNLLEEMDGHKIAVLGDMLELGPYERQGHEMVGVRAAEVSDEVITVGKLGSIIARAARQAGLAANAIVEVETVQQAIELLQSRLHKGDVVLIKGSHGLRMDRIVSALEFIP